MFCTKCGTNLPENVKFCTKCGAPVSQAPVQSDPAGYRAPAEEIQPGANPRGVAATQIRPAAPSVEKQRFCTKCGGSLPENVKFCTKCGAPVAQTPPQSDPAGYRAPAQEIQPGPNSRGTDAVQAKPAAPKKKGKAPIFIFSAIVLVAVIGLAVYFGAKEHLLPFGPDNSAGVVDPAENDDKSNPQDSSRGDDKDPDPVPAQDGVKELVGYIDQATDLVSEMEKELNAISNSTPNLAEAYGKQLPIYNDILTQFTQLQNQAAAIKGLDANAKSAGAAYFDTFCDCTRLCIRLSSFLRDFLAFYEDYVCERPESPNTLTMSDYSNYYNELYNWYLSTKDAFDAIESCPSYMESMWKEYGEALDLNYNIALKIYQAVEYNDWLRLYSAHYMANRYETVEEILRNKFSESIFDELDFGTTQENFALDLADEIVSYGKMDQAHRESYTFRNIYTGDIVWKFDTIDTIYPSLYNTYDAFVVVKLGTIGGTRKVVIEAEIPGFTQKYRQSFTLESSYQTVYIKPPAQSGQLDLSAAKSAQLNVTIYEQDGTTVVTTNTFPLTIKSQNDVDWYSDEYGIATQDNILCFLTPEADAIAKMKRRAADQMSELTGGQVHSFVGYQGSGLSQPATTYLHAAGIMSELYNMGVVYINDGFSLTSHQHVLLPSEVLAERSGLCIETSLVVASALQSANMHAFLVFPPGHAQVAVEIWNSGEWTGKYFLIETTALDDYKDTYSTSVSMLNEQGRLLQFPITYYNSDGWRDYLSSNDAYVIDCNDSTVLGMTPFAN